MLLGHVGCVFRDSTVLYGKKARQSEHCIIYRGRHNLMWQHFLIRYNEDRSRSFVFISFSIQFVQLSLWELREIYRCAATKSSNNNIACPWNMKKNDWLSDSFLLWFFFFVYLETTLSNSGLNSFLQKLWLRTIFRNVSKIKKSMHWQLYYLQHFWKQICKTSSVFEKKTTMEFIWYPHDNELLNESHRCN